MKKIPLELVKELRNMTLASVANCKSALEEAEGDVKKAAQLIRKRGLEIAAKKGERVAKEGRVEAYVHLGNKVGVLLEVDCETDFVARNPEFCQFTKDLAMQITALNPAYIKCEDVPNDILEQEKDKELFCKTHCLLEQAFVKDPSLSIKDYLGSLVAKLSENIVIRRFIRYKIGE
ncbi:MAG: elongation factor Ts [Candidatus Omnitrophica bacterium]|nr:elongation factor Ts [Candidatus Omnitrophota bacterium]MDD5653191.1 elongation factor Ts [Candidatus Omnitrophota bacterium]